jgi:hypothetical protein
MQRFAELMQDDCLYLRHKLVEGFELLSITHMDDGWSIEARVPRTPNSMQGDPSALLYNRLLDELLHFRKVSLEYELLQCLYIHKPRRKKAR